MQFVALHARSYVCHPNSSIINPSPLLLQALNDHSRSTTATVADTNGTNLGLLLLENGSKGGDNTSTRAAKRVTNGDGTTEDVDLLRLETEDLHVGKGNSGESLVDLVVLNLLSGQASVLDGLGNG